MSMPTITCPVCRNALTWETLFAHEGVREAMIALVNAHPAGSRLLRPLLGYVGLFAPEKTVMRYERIAALLDELVEMIRTAQVKRAGTVYAAPADYWINALNEMLARRDSGVLRLPLSSHGYLIEIIVAYSKKAAAAAEIAKEKQRAGHSGFGQSRQQAEPEKKTEMPQHIRDEINAMKEKQKRNSYGNH